MNLWNSLDKPLQHNPCIVIIWCSLVWSVNVRSTLLHHSVTFPVTFKVGLYTLNRKSVWFCSWITNELSDHNGAIEIRWLVYTFPWRQLESSREVQHGDITVGCHVSVECNLQPHTWLKDQAATTDERLYGSYSSEHQNHLSLHNSKLLCHHPWARGQIRPDDDLYNVFLIRA